MFIQPQEFQARLTSVSNLAPNILEFSFDIMNLDWEFKAGQFVMMVFDSLIDETKNVSRAYSIASKPRNNSFDLCVEIIEGGQAGTYFSQLVVGDIVRFKGPYGMCYIKEDNNNDLIMVATGTGIAPIKSIVEDLIAKKDPRKIDILFGLRHEENIFYKDRLQEFSKYPNVQASITLSQAKLEEWDGCRGRVTAHLDKFDWEDKDLYICGNGAMIREVREFGIEKGVPKKQIHVEIFDS